MKNKGIYEKAAINFNEKKRMKKLAGIQENKKTLSSEFKEKIDQLYVNSRKDLDEIK
jgi:hypothetical protein